MAGEIQGLREIILMDLIKPLILTGNIVQFSVNPKFILIAERAKKEVVKGGVDSNISDD